MTFTKVDLLGLLKQMQAGDRSALQEVFRSQYKSVCQVMYRYLKDAHLVEDLAQDLFIKLWDKRESINIESAPEAYIRRMAANEALMYLRKANRMPSDEFSAEHEKSSAPGGESIFLNAELGGKIQEAIQCLPPKCQLVFKLSRFEELSYREIAEKLDISIKTVENQMGKALKILRAQLGQYIDR